MISSTSERRIRRFIESRSYSYSGFDSSEKLLADLIRWDRAERRLGDPVSTEDLARVILGVTGGSVAGATAVRQRQADTVAMALAMAVKALSKR